MYDVAEDLPRELRFRRNIQLLFIRCIPGKIDGESEMVLMEALSLTSMLAY